MKRILAAAALAGSMALVSQAHATCYTPEEVKATQVRQLQTQLMVAALKCSHLPEYAQRYNSFVRAFGPQIADSARVLMAHFKRTSKSPQQSFDRFITQLANTASTVSINTPDFCEGIAATFDGVTAIPGVELANFAATSVNGHTAVPVSDRCQ